MEISILIDALPEPPSSYFQNLLRQNTFLIIQSTIAYPNHTTPGFREASLLKKIANLGKGDGLFYSLMEARSS